MSDFANRPLKTLKLILMWLHINILKCGGHQKTTGCDAKTHYNGLEAIDLNLKDSNNDLLDTDSG
jgi:hypothetical protein